MNSHTVSTGWTTFGISETNTTNPYDMNPYPADFYALTISQSTESRLSSLEKKVDELLAILKRYEPSIGQLAAVYWQLREGDKKDDA